MASLHSVYGSPWQSSSGLGGEQTMRSGDKDPTPTYVAMELAVAAGVLWLLKKYGFRFNFGVSGGR